MCVHKRAAEWGDGFKPQPVRCNSALLCSALCVCKVCCAKCELYFASQNPVLSQTSLAFHLFSFLSCPTLALIHTHRGPTTHCIQSTPTRFPFLLLLLPFLLSSSFVSGNPPVMAEGNSRIYTAVYSGVAVFETIINSIAVMRRRSDSYMNATQILKVAGIEKGRRTKILEREVHSGEHEKVQGGYGKYQGTWYVHGVFFCSSNDDTTDLLFMTHDVLLSSDIYIGFRWRLVASSHNATASWSCCWRLLILIRPTRPT